MHVCVALQKVTFGSFSYGFTLNWEIGFGYEFTWLNAGVTYVAIISIVAENYLLPSQFEYPVCDFTIAGSQGAFTIDTVTNAVTG